MVRPGCLPRNGYAEASYWVGWASFLPKREGHSVWNRIELQSMRLMRRIIAAAVNFMFPPRCVLCGQWHSNASDRLCSDCLELVRVECIREACPRCASAVAPYEVRNGRCRRCRRSRPPIAATVRVGPYSEAMGQLIRSYKFEGCDQLETVLGGWLADAVADAPWLDRVEAIVSVPTHWRRRIRRPAYVAEALSSLVARDRSLPNLPLLRRVRAGPHQVGLSYKDRAENVRGAFTLRRGVSLSRARLLLIDDVKTTGATLKECAKVLHRGGASEVYAAVVVTVGWDDPRQKPVTLL